MSALIVGFGVREEKQLVFLNWSAKAKTGSLAVEGQRRLFEVKPCAKLLIAGKIKATPVKLIATAAGIDIDRSGSG